MIDQPKKPVVLTINIDGAARGNPGPAAFAYVITRDGQVLIEDAKCLGSATNNVAEYTALVRALEKARELGGERLHIRSDSELLVKQMNGLYRVKNNQLRVLYEQAKQLVEHFSAVSITHVRREHNSRADGLCNEVLDGERQSRQAVRSGPMPPPSKTSSPEAVRQMALSCLRSAARAWRQADPRAQSPEEVLAVIWDLLEKNGLLGPGEK
jgi:ribonuclease HI